MAKTSVNALNRSVSISTLTLKSPVVIGFSNQFLHMSFNEVRKLGFGDHFYNIMTMTVKSKMSPEGSTEKARSH